MDISPGSSTPAPLTFLAQEEQGENHGKPSIVDSSLSRSDQSTILGDSPTKEVSMTTCSGSLADDEETILQTPRDLEHQAMETSPTQAEPTVESLPTPGIEYRTKSKDKAFVKPQIMIEGLKSTIKEDIEGVKEVIEGI